MAEAAIDTARRLSPVAGGGERPLPAQGRIADLAPVGIIDIGSNSVRLVVYEGLNRSPTPLFNEKATCALGEGVAETGKLADKSMETAFAALRRFRLLCTHLECAAVHPFATAAVREASNGQDFVEEAAKICGAEIRILTGEEEAELTALGVVSGFRHPHGLVGDLGGGSLELVMVSGASVTGTSSYPLGALRLKDVSGGSVKAARKVVAEILDGIDLPDLTGQPFYAIGGTWRAFAKLHMATIDYPLHVVQSYRIKAKHAMALCRQLQRSGLENLPGHAELSRQRAELLPFGAIVLHEIVRRTNVHSVVGSALGVREGLLFTLLSDEVRRQDPLLTSVEELSILRSRSPNHSRELCAWTDALFALIDPEETEDQRRVRHATCWLADIGWRAHPDYRGEQSVNIIANAALTGIDHAERAILAMTVFYRHAGLGDPEPGPGLRHLTDLDGVQRAALYGAALRVGYQLSASMPGMLPRIGFNRDDDTLSLVLPAELAELGSPRIRNRMKKLASLVSLSGEVVVE